MAVNKSKRSIHLAQLKPQQAKTGLSPQHAKIARAEGPEPQPQNLKAERPELNVNQEPTEQMPVRAHVYQTVLT